MYIHYVCTCMCTCINLSPSFPLPSPIPLPLPFLPSLPPLPPLPSPPPPQMSVVVKSLTVVLEQERPRCPNLPVMVVRMGDHSCKAFHMTVENWSSMVTRLPFNWSEISNSLFPPAKSLSKGVLGAVVLFRVQRHMGAHSGTSYRPEE